MRARHGLYFIRNKYTGLIKIGVTGDINQRLHTLECSNGVPLDVIRFVEGAGRYEEELHKCFADVRTIGEWFFPCDDLEAVAAGLVSIDDMIAQRASVIEAWAAQRRERLLERKNEMEAEAAERRELESAQKALRAQLKAARDAEAKKAAARKAVRDREEAERVRAAMDSRRAEQTGTRWTVHPSDIETRNAERMERRVKQLQRNQAYAGVGK